MKNFYKILSGFTVFLFLLTLTIPTYAATHSNSSSFWPLVQCGNSGQPDCDFTEATILVNRLINWFISMAGTVAVITFSLAGGKILLNPEDPGKIKEGKDMLWKTIVGMLIVLGAWLLVRTVVSALVRSPDALRFLGN